MSLKMQVDLQAGIKRSCSKFQVTVEFLEDLGLEWFSSQICFTWLHRRLLCYCVIVLLKDSELSSFKWVCVVADCRRAKYISLFFFQLISQQSLLVFDEISQEATQGILGEPTFSCVLWSDIHRNIDIPTGFYVNNSSNDNNRNISPSAMPHSAVLLHVGISYLLFSVQSSGDPEVVLNYYSWKSIHTWEQPNKLTPWRPPLLKPPCSRVWFENGRLAVAHPDRLLLQPSDGRQHFCLLHSLTC